MLATQKPYAVTEWHVGMPFILDKINETISSHLDGDPFAEPSPEAVAERAMKDFTWEFARATRYMGKFFKVYMYTGDDYLTVTLKGRHSIRITVNYVGDVHSTSSL